MNKAGTAPDMRDINNRANPLLTMDNKPDMRIAKNKNNPAYS
jgi:hypothetical protein